MGICLNGCGACMIAAPVNMLRESDSNGGAAYRTAAGARNASILDGKVIFTILVKNRYCGRFTYSP